MQFLSWWISDLLFEKSKLFPSIINVIFTFLFVSLSLLLSLHTHTHTHTHIYIYIYIRIYPSLTFSCVVGSLRKLPETQTRRKVYFKEKRKKVSHLATEKCHTLCYCFNLPPDQLQKQEKVKKFFLVYEWILKSYHTTNGIWGLLYPKFKPLNFPLLNINIPTFFFEISKIPFVINPCIYSKIFHSWSFVIGLISCHLVH